MSKTCNGVQSICFLLSKGMRLVRTHYPRCVPHDRSGFPSLARPLTSTIDCSHTERNSQSFLGRRHKHFAQFFNSSISSRRERTRWKAQTRRGVRTLKAAHTGRPQNLFADTAASVAMQGREQKPNNDHNQISVSATDCYSLSLRTCQGQ